MALASCSVKIISRGKGKSAVAASAYRAGAEMHDERDGQSYDYSRKTGIVHTEMVTPSHAPDWTHERQELWNKVEQCEKRKDAQLAREVMIALPQELTQAQNIQLARAYAQTFVNEGMIADVAVHDKGDGNPHAHILLTLRTLDGETFGQKCREWNAREKVEEWRQTYEKITNYHLERHGHSERIDVRSYERQGIEQTPTVHLGHYAHGLEQQGQPSELGNKNRTIQGENQQRVELKELKSELAQVNESIQIESTQQEEARRQEVIREHTISEEALRQKAVEWEREAREAVMRETTRLQAQSMEEQRKEAARFEALTKEAALREEARKSAEKAQAERAAIRKSAEQAEQAQREAERRYQRKFVRPHRLQRPARIGRQKSRPQRPDWSKLAEALQAKRGKMPEATRPDWAKLAEQLETRRIDWKTLDQQLQAQRRDYWAKMAQQQEAARPDWAKPDEYTDLYKQASKRRAEQHKEQKRDHDHGR